MRNVITSDRIKRAINTFDANELKTLDWATAPSVLSNNKDNKSSDKKRQGLVSSEKDVSRGQFGFFIYFYSLAVIHDPKGNWNTNCDIVEVHGVCFSVLIKPTRLSCCAGCRRTVHILTTPQKNCGPHQPINTVDCSNC